MKKDLTEIICIIDRSGSMSSIKDDAIGGFNNFLNEQKKVPGEATLTLVQFNDEYDVIYENEPIQNVNELNDNTYVPSHTTALLDAVGKTIDTVGERLSTTPEDKKPEKVIVCILTDGYENSSKKYSREDIQSRIKHQREQYKWEFVFLAANQDAFAEAGDLNINTNMAFNYKHTGDGIKGIYGTLSDTVSAYRSGTEIGDNDVKS